MTCLALYIHMVSHNACGSVTSELMRFISHFITSKHLPHPRQQSKARSLHSQPAVTDVGYGHVFVQAEKYMYEHNEMHARIVSCSDPLDDSIHKGSGIAPTQAKMH